MKSRLLLLALIVLSVETYGQQGQNGFMNDANGRPFYRKTEYQAVGSPYYYDDYCLADLHSASGKVYTGVLVKLNLMENLLLYQVGANEFIANTPVTRIKFYNYARDGKVYPEIELVGIDTALNVPGTSIYELVADGEAKLLNRQEVSYSDLTDYGSSTITRTFKRKETLYARAPEAGKEVVKVTKSKDGVASLFGKDAGKVGTYIAENRLKCKSEADLASVFKYYNSLYPPLKTM